MGVNECGEPITSNIYNERTLAGEFMMTNKYLMHDLLKLDLWNEKIQKQYHCKQWWCSTHRSCSTRNAEVNAKQFGKYPLRNLIDMAADRGVYICQANQGLNLWLEEARLYTKLTSMQYIHGQKDRKSGIYYLRHDVRVIKLSNLQLNPRKKPLKLESFGDDEHVYEMHVA